MRIFATWGAILAVLATLNAPAGGNEPPDNRIVRFQLADGVRVAGRLSAWDESGIDGTFGSRSWQELRTADVWRLYRVLMDREDAGQWLALGRIMLEMPDAGDRPDEALERALALDPELAPRIETIRAEAAERLRERRQREAELESERLNTAPPEAAAWQAQAWPSLSEREQEAAVASIRAEAASILERIGLHLEPVETDFFLFYSDMPRRDVARWAMQLDNMYGRVARIFDLPPTENIFWGKAVIFVFDDRDRFALLEAQAFNQLVPQSVAGHCHFRGPRVFIDFHRQPDDHAFAALLVHETVHGFMHRYRTPHRLPTWANEGFSDYLASVTFANSPMDRERRRAGLAFVRGGGDVNDVLDWGYDDASWPGPDSVGYSVGYLLVELMIRDRARRFGDWVNAVKAGKDWQLALTEDFGVPRGILVERFVRFYQVND